MRRVISESSVVMRKKAAFPSGKRYKVFVTMTTEKTDRNKSNFATIRNRKETPCSGVDGVAKEGLDGTAARFGIGVGGAETRGLEGAGRRISFQYIRDTFGLKTDNFVICG